MVAQRLERAQQHRQPLALNGLADEEDAQRPTAVGHVGVSIAYPRIRLGLSLDPPQAGRIESHPVGHDPVAATVEAPRRPRGGLGDGDADV